MEYMHILLEVSVTYGKSWLKLKRGAVAIFFNRRAQEEKPEDILMDTEVYSCSDESCNGWMRKDFASADLKCPLCGNETNMEIRELPKIN
ncbi:putative RNA-binding Zn-ribbon protein involved in translation (DUF1610 family) [Robertmurraya andreesenii]|uniref:RNA-binding Zn-ribbon protein involved in translation (DUF1610 family) n=2 Tax=Anoxybacillus andreesenii TaxID=1325932 RepID=A0ABT9V704_9BACL|nr:putative RNA-binding Zn-ribbon protein involved in translation (DUF1610 family) [Robertmurraya andreesenii]